MGNHKSFLIAVFLLIVAIAGLLCPLPNHYRSPWLMKLLDLGHVPLFFMATLCFWAICGRKILLAMGLATALAVAAEIVQSQIDRSGDMWDVLRGMIGVALAGCVLQLSKGPFQWRNVALGTPLAIALLLWPIYDCGPVLVDAVQAYRSFPVLSDFQSRWETRRWYAGGVLLDRRKLADPEDVWVGRLQVLPNDSGGELILFPVIGNWSRYRRLICVFSFSGEPLNLLISIRDGNKVPLPLKRFDLERLYSAGRHRVEIDLDDLKNGTNFAPVDVAGIQSFHFVVTCQTELREVFLHEVYLD